MSSYVKSDPADLTGLKKHSWSQNLKLLSQKTKKRGNNAVSRRFGKYSFQIVETYFSELDLVTLDRTFGPKQELDTNIN